jgi:hypothetical protein
MIFRASNDRNAQTKYRRTGRSVEKLPELFQSISMLEMGWSN